MKGRHAIIECYGKQAHLSAEELVQLMEAAASKAGAKILNSHVHRFGEGMGNTGVIMLAESHISVHTWPENNYAAFDIFMCGEQVDLNQAIDHITDYDADSECRVKVLRRGNAVSSSADADELAASFLQDTPGLTKKILDNTSIQDDGDVSPAVIETVKFLMLCANSEQSLTPSRIVDEVWHEMILFTRHYQQFCQDNFHQFIHHAPSGDSESNQRQYEYTISLYRENFGTPDLRFWNDAGVCDSHCGTCEKD